MRTRTPLQQEDVDPAQSPADFLAAVPANLLMARQPLEALQAGMQPLLLYTQSRHSRRQPHVVLLHLGQALRVVNHEAIHLFHGLGQLLVHSPDASEDSLVHQLLQGLAVAPQLLQLRRQLLRASDGCWRCQLLTQQESQLAHVRSGSHLGLATRGRCRRFWLLRDDSGALGKLAPQALQLVLLRLLPLAQGLGGHAARKGDLVHARPQCLQRLRLLCLRRTDVCQPDLLRG
mmetsp:Transcript_32961/g.94503  ORF Transcript_32961/g.94503 Transcript_32961/m.94503 type:complete len:232 (-) Transcript_32961:2727-3422(-)